MPKRSPTPDPEFLAAVASDLGFLREEWDSTISDQSLRRSSTVLRNLLVEGALGRAWRMAGKPKEPRVTAFDLATILSRVSREKVAFASAGGANSGGVQVAGTLILSGAALNDAEIEQMFEPMTRVPPGSPPEPPRTVFRLSPFVASPTMVVNGEEISRRELVKYVANKLGARTTTIDERSGLTFCSTRRWRRSGSQTVGRRTSSCSRSVRLLLLPTTSANCSRPSRKNGHATSTPTRHGIDLLIHLVALRD